MRASSWASTTTARADVRLCYALGVTLRHSVLVLAALALAPVVALRPASAEPNVSSLASSPVTVYGAKWCSACKSLESALTARKVAFEVVDVDERPSAFARAREASGTGGSIPLTSIATPSRVVWVVGADPDAVERAQRSD